MRTNKFRGQRIDNNEFVFGYYRKYTFHNKLADNPKEIYTKHFIGSFSNLDLFNDIFEQVEVKSETVGQLIYTNKEGVEYYEGDVYYCAGYGNDIVSELCQIHDRLLCGESEDIGDIIGNIHENPELLK